MSVLAAGVIGRARAATDPAGLFAGQFLEDGHVVNIPAGHYDREMKVFVEEESGLPMVQQASQMTGSWTYSDTTRCTNMFYPNDGSPYCAAYDSDQDSHPDGFKPGE
ncbi:MAG: hypothetical protein ABTQ29_12735 [Siculibacillus sp.]